MMSSGRSWNAQIERITGNANRTPGFLKRNIKIKLPKLRETAYNMLVRPQLEYASAIRHPYIKDKLAQKKYSAEPHEGPPVSVTLAPVSHLC